MMMRGRGFRIVIGQASSRIDVTRVEAQSFLARDRIEPLIWLVRIWNKPFVYRKLPDFIRRLAYEFLRMDLGTDLRAHTNAPLNPNLK